jgi:hypothetical protein
VNHTRPVNSWQGQYPDMARPTPAPAGYQSRLAWVTAFHVTDRANCPGVSQTDAPSPDGAYNGYYYEVFIIDAATGGDAVTTMRPCPSSAAARACPRPASASRSS